MFLAFPWDLSHFSSLFFRSYSRNLYAESDSLSKAILGDNRIAVWLFKPRNLHNFRECGWPEKTSEGFQCDGLSPNFVVSRHSFTKLRSVARLIWHHRTIEDVAAFDFCSAIEWFHGSHRSKDMISTIFWRIFLKFSDPSSSHYLIFPQRLEVTAKNI